MIPCRRAGQKALTRRYVAQAVEVDASVRDDLAEDPELNPFLP